MAYYGAPREPEGGWKNNAQWIGNVQKWTEDMIRQGFNLSDVMKIYQDEIGEPFPKNLKNTIEGNDWLFPGQDAMYEYDLAHHQKRHFTYNDPAQPGQQKGPFDWVPMEEGEIANANQYYGWRNDPSHAWMFGANAENPEGHPYQAWLQQWGNRWKDPGWTPPKAMGIPTTTQDIFHRPGYDASGRPINSQITKPITPLTPSGTPTRPEKPINPKEQSVSTASTSAPNLVGYGNPIPPVKTNVTGPNVQSSGLGYEGLGLNPRKRKPVNLNTSTASNPYFTF